MTPTGTAFFNRHNDESILVADSFEDVLPRLLDTGEFIVVTDPDDGPYLLRTSLIDLAISADKAEDDSQEVEETPAT